MNKSDLADRVADDTGMPKAVIGSVVDSVFDQIAAALGSGGEVSIAGFGKFDVAERAARKGRNPQTGQEIMIAAKKAPRFKAAKQLKETTDK